METRKKSNSIGSFVLSVLLLLATSAAVSQEILLDRQERCGEMLCYRSLDDPLVYYYLPDSPRLATRNGKPQFSFLKYARTQETGEAGITRAQGGGIVHFLVTYGADEARVQTAEQGLQESVPGARIAGPIVYRKGSFALVTSFTEENETVTRTVAVGKAPLMEGQKAAVSMALTREGAELLWESFQSATPDISLVFDMEFAGVREPYEAKLEADWARVSKHKRIQAGAKYKWFGVDVDMLFQELRQDGAVKITTRGENATLDKILESANAKLLQVMFDPAPTGELARMASDKGYSSLDQAVKMLKTGKPTAGAKFKRISRSSVYGFDRRRVRFAVLRDDGPGRASPARLAPATLRGATDERAKKFFAQAEEAYAAKDYERAFGLYMETLAYGEGSPWAHTVGYNIGQCLRKLGRCKEAVKWYQDYVQKASDKTGTGVMWSHVHQADCSLVLGRGEDSLRHAREASSLMNFTADASERTNALTTVANVFDLLGLFAESAVHYFEAADAAKADTTKASELEAKGTELAAKAYGEAQRLDEAASESDYAPKAAEKAIGAYARYQTIKTWPEERFQKVEARISFLSAKLEQAAAAPQAPTEAVSPSQEAPDSSTNVSASTLAECKALFRKGQELYLKEDFEGALDAFSRVVDLWPLPPPNEAALAFRFNVGGVLKKMNRCEEALEHFRFYLSFKPDMEAEAAQASCLDALVRFGEARESWLRAAALSTKQETLQQNYHGLAGSLERAERYAESAEYYRESASLLAEGSAERGGEQAKADEMAERAYGQARRLDDAARQAGYEREPTQQAYQAYVAYRDHLLPEGSRAAEVNARIDFLAAKLGGAQVASQPGPGGEDTAQRGEGQTGSPPKTPGAASTPKPGAAAAWTESLLGKGKGDLESTQQLAGLEPDDDLDSILKGAPELGSMTTPTTTTPAAGKEGATGDAELKKLASELGLDAASGLKGSLSTSKPKSSTASKSKSIRSTKVSPAAKKRKGGSPGFSLVASYQMKRIKTSGHLVFEMNHMRNETQAFAMTENVGDLYRRWGNDPQVFRAVNIDDPVFKQREILVTLDGQDAATFSEHVNFVSVQLEKRHQSGEVTTDEVVISPQLFEAEGNAFFLRYGWKGDDDRERWLGYNVKTVWSFHGGMEVRSDWEAQDTPMLALAPPHRYRTVTVEGEGDRLTNAAVRHGVVKVTSRVAGRQLVQEATIRNRGPVPTAVLEVAEDPEGPETTFEITWYLEGARTVDAAPRPLAGDLVYWDEVPEEAGDV